MIVLSVFVGLNLRGDFKYRAYMEEWNRAFPDPDAEVPVLRRWAFLREAPALEYGWPMPFWTKRIRLEEFYTEYRISFSWLALSVDLLAAIAGSGATMGLTEYLVRRRADPTPCERILLSNSSLSERG
jgi:hypothetical protein